MLNAHMKTREACLETTILSAGHQLHTLGRPPRKEDGGGMGGVVLDVVPLVEGEQHGDALLDSRAFTEQEGQENTGEEVTLVRQPVMEVRESERRRRREQQSKW